MVSLEITPPYRRQIRNFIGLKPNSNLHGRGLEQRARGGRGLSPTKGDCLVLEMDNDNYPH